MAHNLNSIVIRELDPQTLIAPTVDTMFNKKTCGSKTILIGRGAGKQAILTSLLYEKRHIFPRGFAFSGTVEGCEHLSEIIPPLFVYDKYNAEALEALMEYQKQIIQSKNKLDIPWSAVILDDVCDKKTINSELIASLFQNGGRLKLWCLMTQPYCLPPGPNVRIHVNGVFIMRENSPKMRKTIFETYVPLLTWPQFNCVMDEVCKDYTALYFNYQTESNNIEDVVFYYRAKEVPADWRFGSDDFWDYNNERCDPAKIIY